MYIVYRLVAQPVSDAIVAMIKLCRQIIGPAPGIKCATKWLVLPAIMDHGDIVSRVQACQQAFGQVGRNVRHIAGYDDHRCCLPAMDTGLDTCQWPAWCGPQVGQHVITKRGIALPMAVCADQDIHLRLIGKAVQQSADKRYTGNREPAFIGASHAAAFAAAEDDQGVRSGHGWHSESGLCHQPQLLCIATEAIRLIIGVLQRQCIPLSKYPVGLQIPFAAQRHGMGV